MNITKANTAITFPSVESRINWWATYLLRITFFGFLLFFFCLFVLGPAYGIYKRGWKAMFSVTLMCWTISLVVLIPVIHYYIIRRKKMTNKMVINHFGILFYNSKNEVTEQILYSELRPSKKNFDIFIITPVGSAMVPLLEVTVREEKKDDEARRIDMNLPLHIVKNKTTLYAHFMHGISIFRPDLKIDPIALKSFSVDPETWEVHKSKGISWGGWLLILTAIIISGIIIGISFLLSK